MKLLSTLSLLPILTSCSFKIPHSDGSSSYLGWVRINEPSEEETPIRHTRRYGLAIDSGFKNSGVLLGYQDQVKIIPPRDSITRFDYSTGGRQYSGEIQRTE